MLLRTKRRREQNLEKGSSGSTKFDRELKKLEWSINYNGAMNLLPLSWGKTICVGRGSAPKIIEVMLQRPYGVRGLVSLRFSRRILWSEKVGLNSQPLDEAKDSFLECQRG